MVDVVYPWDVNAWKGGAPVEPNREEALVSAIAAATAWVQREGVRRSLGKIAAPVTLLLDGDDATGRGRKDLWLPADIRPVWHAGGTLVTVTESGSALTVATGYSSSSDVVLKGVNEDARVCLHHRGGWHSDKQNVAVVLTHGWDPDIAAAVLALPVHVKLLVIELSWAFYSGQGAADVTLSPLALETLSSLRGL